VKQLNGGAIMGRGQDIFPDVTGQPVARLTVNSRYGTLH
jgi:hypothetical protein